MSNYELEKNEPSIEDLIKIAQILDVSVDYLIGASNVYRNFYENSFSTVSFEWFVIWYDSLTIYQREKLKKIIPLLIDF